MKHWFVYMLRCADDSLYIGMTDDLQKRVAAHNAGTGAKYTRGRGPVQLVYWEHQLSKSAALRREARLKRLPRQQKLALCAGFCGEIHELKIEDQQVLCIVDDRILPVQAYLSLLQEIYPGEYDVQKTEYALGKTRNVTAWKGNVLIGCVRVLTDGYYTGMVAEHLKLPEYDRYGIGDTLWELASQQIPATPCQRKQ